MKKRTVKRGGSASAGRAAVVPLPENAISVPKLTQSYIDSEMDRLCKTYPTKYKSANKTVRTSPRSPGKARYELVTDLTYILKEGKTYTPVTFNDAGSLVSEDGKEWQVRGKQKYKLYVSKAEYDRRVARLDKMGVSHISRFGE